MKKENKAVSGKKKIKLGLKAKILIIAAGIIVLSVISLIMVRKIIEAHQLESATYTVKSELYENSIEIAGTIAAAQEQTLQALSTGTVLAVYVEKGDRVKKGDIIIQLDSTEQEYNLAKLDYDMDSSRITGAKKQLQLQEKQRLSLLQKIEDRKVVATFDGIIADLDVAVGDSMEAKDSVGTLVNVDYLKADVEISETDVAKLKVGQKVQFTFPAYSGTVEGYVVGWPAIGEITSRGATVVNAEVRIDEYPEEILPNFSFTGKIQITEPVKNLIVESYAVGRENGNAFVQLASSNEKIPVKVQPYGMGYVKIVSGDVKEGSVLKAQSKPKTSGTNRNGPSGMNSSNKNRTSGMNQGMPPMMR